MNKLINSSNNKLLSILESFSKVELNRLKKFVESPYFNVNQEIITLNQYIYSHFDKEFNFTKEELWIELNKKESFNSLKVRKLFSDLLKLVEQFLAQEVYENNKLLKANYLLKSVSNKNLKKLISTSLSNAYRTSEKSPLRESEFFLYQYQREKNIYELKNSDLDRNSESNLNQIVNYLDYFYLAEKMRYLCEIIVRENIISMDYQILFRDEIVAHLKKYKYDDVPLVSVYYHMFLTLTEDKDENYFKLKELLEKHIDIFPNYEAKEIYTSAINYCSRKINSGNNKFLSEFLQLNESLIEKNIIENELGPWKFKNIISVALKLGKFEWAENFIENYKNKLPERYKENAITFNTAQLYFYQKRYEELLPILLQVEYEDFTYRLNTKLFTVITYFELGEDEAILSFIDSFKTYLRRQKTISNKRQQNYINFLKHTKKLVKNKFEKNQVVLLKMQREIQDNGKTVSKEWLLEKIDQLLYPNGTQRDPKTEYSNRQFNQSQS